MKPARACGACVRAYYVQYGSTFFTQADRALLLLLAAERLHSIRTQKNTVARAICII